MKPASVPALQRADTVNRKAGNADEFLLDEARSLAQYELRPK